MYSFEFKCFSFKITKMLLVDLILKLLMSSVPGTLDSGFM